MGPGIAENTRLQSRRLRENDKHLPLLLLHFHKIEAYFENEHIGKTYHISTILEILQGQHDSSKFGSLLSPPHPEN